MKDEIRNRNVRMLYKAFLALENEEECEAFLADLCTDAEISAMAQRPAVAAMIADGKKYDEIAETTGSSPAIISRVKRCMHNYEKTGILDKIKS